MSLASIIAYAFAYVNSYLYNSAYMPRGRFFCHDTKVKGPDRL